MLSDSARERVGVVADGDFSGRLGDFFAFCGFGGVGGVGGLCVGALGGFGGTGGGVLTFGLSPVC